MYFALFSWFFPIFRVDYSKELRVTFATSEASLRIVGTMQLLEGIFIAHRSYVARMKTKSQKQIMRSFPALHRKGQNVKSREEPANAR